MVSFSWLLTVDDAMITTVAKWSETDVRNHSESKLTFSSML